MKYWKKSITIAFVLAMLILTISCRSYKNGNGMIEFDKNPPFKVSDSFIQPWVAGIKEAGSGKDITLKFSYDPGSEVLFSKIFVEGGSADIPNYGINPEAITATVRGRNERPDTIMSDDPVEEAANKPSDRFKFDLDEDEVVIKYNIGDDIGYFKLDSVPVKELLAYPSANPDNEQKP